MSLQAADHTVPSGLPDTGNATGNERAVSREARHAARSLLLERVRDRLGGNDALWLEDCLAAVAESDPVHEPRTFDLAFGLAPRRLGREPLVPDDEDRDCLARNADACLAGWRPADWRIDEAVRVLLLTAAGDEAVPFLFARALRHADLGEQLALYRALPLLAGDAAIVDVVRRGLRTNMRAVFEAIAHGNPWPARHLDEAGWNHLVLKALFVESALAPILGLDERANEELTVMLIDFASERRAAGRPIPAELWRALGPFATQRALAPLLPLAGIPSP